METPFYYQQVVDAAERQRFITNYKRVSGNELPARYVRRAVVIQFYIGTRAVAGFILNTAEMNLLRYLWYLASSVRKAMLANEGLKESEFLEITANWILPSLSRQQRRFYYQVMLTMAYRHGKRLGKKYLLGGSVIRKIQVLQQALMTRTIYHGPISHRSQTGVKKRSALLKLYVIEVDKLPLRAVLALTNRYLIQALKNTLAQWLRRWRDRAPVRRGAGGGQLVGS